MKKRHLPTPISRAEAIALGPYEDRVQIARTQKKIAASLALVAGVVLGADALSDNDLDTPAKVSMVYGGLSTARVMRENRKQHQAIEEAHDLLRPEQMTVHVQREDQ